VGPFGVFRAERLLVHRRDHCLSDDPHADHPRKRRDEGDHGRDAGGLCLRDRPPRSSGEAARRRGSWPRCGRALPS
jgi:hypothetical protein